MLVKKEYQDGWLQVKSGDRLGYVHPDLAEDVRTGKLSTINGPWVLVENMEKEQDYGEETETDGD